MEIRVVDYILISVISVTLLGGAIWVGGLSAKVSAMDANLSDTMAAELSGTEKHFQDNEQLPTGTVISSVLEPKVFFANGKNSQWRLASGKPIPLESELKKIVEHARISDKNNLPDLRGMFIRGMSEDRRDGKHDPEGRSRVVGSYQGSATKLPQQSFKGVTATSGKHTHSHRAPSISSAGAGGFSLAAPDGSSTTSSEGLHSHQIAINSGGDSETRPRNIALYFYIKVR